MLAVVHTNDIKKAARSFLKHYGNFSIEQGAFSSHDADAVLLRIYHHNEDGTRMMLAMLVISQDAILVRTRAQYNSGLNLLAVRPGDSTYKYNPATFTAWLKVNLLPYLQ